MLAAIKHIAAEIIFIRKQHTMALCMQHSPTDAVKKTLSFIALVIQPLTI